MAFQDATGGGSEGFQQPWMSPKDLPSEEPEFLRAERSISDSGSGSGRSNRASGLSWAVTGLPVTSQGGGAVSGQGGGIGGGPSSGNWALGAYHRGLLGGLGIRTGGYY